MPKLVETTYEVKGIQSMEAIMQQVLREDHRGLMLILRQEPNGVLKATGAMPVPREPNLVLLCRDESGHCLKVDIDYEKSHYQPLRITPHFCPSDENEYQFTMSSSSRHWPLPSKVGGRGHRNGKCFLNIFQSGVVLFLGPTALEDMETFLKERTHHTYAD